MGIRQVASAGTIAPVPHNPLFACRVHGRGLNQRALHQHEKEQQLLPFALRWASRKELPCCIKRVLQSTTAAGQVAHVRPTDG